MILLHLRPIPPLSSSNYAKPLRLVFQLQRLNITTRNAIEQSRNLQQMLGTELPDHHKSRGVHPLLYYSKYSDAHTKSPMGLEFHAEGGPLVLALDDKAVGYLAQGRGIWRQLLWKWDGRDITHCKIKLAGEDAIILELEDLETAGKLADAVARTLKEKYPGRLADT